MGIFKAYDIRGIVPDEFNPDLAYKIANAAAQFLEVENIVVGRDMRMSSPAIGDAAKRGIRDAGVDVIDIGLCSTPASYFANGAGGYGGSIMITASHNPARYNGFKLCREQAIPLSYETGIEEIEILFNPIQSSVKIYFGFLRAFVPRLRASRYGGQALWHNWVAGVARLR
ncbi:MAG: hypothetical protein NTV79_03815 [Candidatus Aureabacteria bacterium]|nr:hypothetical protein [Candidatus Auribacterota bacterium]